jgi:hypothetical protein
MSRVLFNRLALCAALSAVFPATALAGGFNGGSGQYSAITPQNAQAILSYADRHQDGNFKVDHTESASAEATTGPGGETGSGYAYSNTDIESDASVKSWKRSVQRTSGSASNGQASGSGFSASFVKVRTSDGKYYIFKGMANTSASASASGTASSTSGIARSVGGRY